MNSIHELRIMNPAAVRALNKHKARARRAQIAIILNNGIVGEVEKLLLEEEDAQLEQVLLTKEEEV